jgi:hypothetical protein
MKQNITLALVALIAILILANADWNDRTVIYDCSLAEISPDYPPEVKNECRRLRIEQFQQQQHIERKTIST